MQLNIHPIGCEYRVIEIADLPPGRTPAGAYACLDVEQKIIWLWAGTPRVLREKIVARARRIACQVATRAGRPVPVD